MKNIIVNIVLLVIIIALIPMVSNSIENAEPPANYRDKRYQILSGTVEEVEKTEENTKDFSEFDLNEEYGKKKMYEVVLEINNYGEEILDEYEVGYIYVKDQSGKIFSRQQKEYYSGIPTDSNIYASVIPGKTTVTMTYYILIEEDDIPEQLYIYEDYDSEEYIVIDMP